LNAYFAIAHIQNFACYAKLFIAHNEQKFARPIKRLYILPASFQGYNAVTPIFIMAYAFQWAFPFAAFEPCFRASSRAFKRGVLNARSVAR
jgi:hypothetical protein